MINVKKILCPIDVFPCSGQAFERALQLAEMYGAELHMLHAIVLHQNDVQYPTMSVVDYEDIYQYLEDHARMEMRVAVASREDRANIVIVGKRGMSAADVILEYADANDMDLIVMGTHGRRGLGRLFLGSVAEKVVRSIECPVLTVREGKDHAATRVGTILVPVDFSEHSKAALIHAKELAATYGSKLQLLHVIEESPYPEFYGMGDLPDRMRRKSLKERAIREMEQLCDECGGPGIEPEVHILSGHPARDIVRFARDNESDLIVLASHGLTGLEHLLLGSVAEKVVRMAQCPVFTVKAFGKSLTSESCDEYSVAPVHESPAPLPAI